MVSPIDPTAVGFLLAENRNMPMHVGGLQLFKKPDDAGRIELTPCVTSHMLGPPFAFLQAEPSTTRRTRSAMLQPATITEH